MTLLEDTMNPADEAASTPRRGHPARGASIGPSRVTRVIILALAVLFLGTPLAALFGFTIRGGLAGGLTAEHWAGVFSGDLGAAAKPLTTGVQNSLGLALVTVALMLALLVPTMVLVRLHLPRWEKLIEFICLLPLTIPAVALVVGLAPVFRVVSQIFGSASWTLSFAYVILVLPFSYRAIHANLMAVDVVTLTQAARSLGASWFHVLWDVILPNLRRGILAASFISVAAVLGEFTIASLLSRTNLQTSLVLVAKQDPYLSNIVVVLSLVFAFILLIVIGRIGNHSRRSRS